MAKRNNTGDGKSLFDIKNLEQAKNIISQIKHILDKGFASTANKGSNIQEYIDDMDNLAKLWTDLQKLSNTGLKNINMMTDNQHNLLKREIKLLEKVISDKEYELKLQQRELDFEREKGKAFAEGVNYINQQVEATDKLSEAQKKAKQQVEALESELSDVAKQYEGIKLENIGEELIQGSKWDKQKSNAKIKYNQQAQSVVEDIIQKFKSEGKFDQAHKGEMERAIKNALKQPLVEYNKISLKANLASSALQAAADTLKAGFTKFFQMFSDSLNKQSQLYEDTFQNLSVRNGLTQSQYRQTQRGVNNMLSDMGLRDNIATSSVQEMWSKLSDQGIKIDMSTSDKQAEATANAIETVLTNQIVPYLDMSSSYMQQLSDRNGYLMKQVRGIGTSIMNVDDTLGNTIVNKYLQDMLDSLSPMAELANEEIGVQYAQSLGMYEELRAKGMSDVQIGEMYSNLKSTVEDPYKAVTSGDISKQLTVINTIQNGGDLHNVADVTEGQLEGLKTITGMYAIGKNSSLPNGAITSGMGLSYNASTVDWMSNNLTGVDYDMAMAIRNKLSQSDLEKIANDNTNIFKNGGNQTAKQRQNITVENLTNEMATLKESMGEWFSVLTTAVKGIGTVLTTYLGGKFLTSLAGGKIGTWISGMFTSSVATEAATGALAGTGGAVGAGAAGSGGLFATLGAAGPIALGIAAVGASVAAGVAIGNHILNKEDKKVNEFKQNKTENLLAEGFTSNENVAGATALIEAQQKDKHNNMSSEQKKALGIETHWWQSSATEYTKSLENAEEMEDWGKYNQLRAIAAFDKSSGLDKDSQFNVMAAMLIEALAGNVLTRDGGPFATSGVHIESVDDIAEFLYANKIGKKRLKQGFKTIQDNSWYLVDGTGKPIYDMMTEELMKTITGSENYLQNYNEHRQGLDNVPYDNYPALLHEGEAVLTASTANEMRNMVDEYRDNNTKQVDFDVIIQSQTVSLVNKLDELIQAVGNLSSPMSNTVNNINNSTQNTYNERARSLVQNSVMHIRNTRSFVQ